jgi:ribose transport system substrate-binding protein
MKMVLKYTILLLVSLVTLISCECGKGTKQETTIALVVKTLNHPFFNEMERGASEAAQRLGVKLIVQGAEREVDVEKQMQIIENLIQARVNALCITPSGSREIVPAIVKANRAGIPVLAVDTRVDEKALREAGGTVATFIGSDNFEGGRLAGEFIAKKLGGKGTVAILEGIPGHETGDSRLKGFRSVIDSIEGIQVVSSQTANWERDQGYNVFQNILQAHPNVTALFACNDLMALGAVEAIAAVKKTGKIVVVGFDALADAQEAIRKNSMAASVIQHPKEMGRIAVESAYKVLKGESIPENIPVSIGLVTKETLVSAVEK